MLDVRRIREEPDRVREGLARRGDPELPGMVDEVLALDEKRRRLVGELDDMRRRHKELSREIAELRKAGKLQEANAKVPAAAKLGGKIKVREGRLDRRVEGPLAEELPKSPLKEVEDEIERLLLRIPNLPDPDVPTGGAEANRVLREWGEAPAFAFEPLPHWELGERLGILDLARGAKVAGSGFPAYIGLGARLERALINFMMDLHAGEHGYTEVWPPFLVNHRAALGTGQLPKFGEDMYEVPADGFYLVPTAEVPVTNLHAGELLGPDALPIRYVAYTPCFRREAGAHGKETRGLIRVHQFDKVELVRFERPEAAPAALEELTGHAEAVLRRLGLRYRVLLLAAGDLGFANAKTYDIEVWAPGVGRWLEVSSCSSYTDYQARRAEIRFRPEPGGRPEFVHTLNGSGLALARTVVALLESYQEADGSVRIPEALTTYMGTDRIG